MAVVVPILRALTAVFGAIGNPVAALHRILEMGVNKPACDVWGVPCLL